MSWTHIALALSVFAIPDLIYIVRKHRNPTPKQQRSKA
jgi:hypothetical protein